MAAYFAEFVGTAILILLGNGVVANVLLEKTKGHAGGLIVITLGWGMAVFVAVLCVAEISGAHINPAVTIALATAGKIAWPMALGYLAAQMLGAMLGAALVYVFYHDHYGATDDADAKMATFCTSPAIRRTGLNLFSEAAGTFVLVFAVLMAAEPWLEFDAADDATSQNAASSEAASPGATMGLGALGALPVALVVLAIGLSLGGTTGYAINPARDLGPRIVHALLPIPGKRDSDWSYAWIPVVGPILGGLLAVAVKTALLSTE